MLRIRYYGDVGDSGVSIPYKNVWKLRELIVHNDLAILPKTFEWNVAILEEIVRIVNRMEDEGIGNIESRPIVTMNGPNAMPFMSGFGYPVWINEIMDLGVDKVWVLYSALKCVKYLPGMNVMSKILTLFVYAYIVNDSDAENDAERSRLIKYMEAEFYELWKNNQ